MSKITVVDYQSIPGKANEIQEKGEYINSELSTAYTAVDELKSTWHGLKYNTLISYFNKITDEINSLLKLVINDIPTSLGTIAKNYATADGTSVAAVPSGSITAISNIADSDTSTMAYDSSSAANVKTSVKSNFTNAQGAMEDIQTIFNSISWESAAKESFSRTLNNLKTTICNEFATIDTEFTKLMEQSEADISGAETANDVEA